MSGGGGQTAVGRGGGEAAAAGDDVGDLAAVGFAGVALVQVGVAGEDSVGPEACFGRRGVDVVGKPGAAAMVGVDGGGRVVAGDDHRPFAGLAGGRKAL